MQWDQLTLASATPSSPSRGRRRCSPHETSAKLSELPRLDRIYAREESANLIVVAERTELLDGGECSQIPRRKDALAAGHVSHQTTTISASQKARLQMAANARPCKVTRRPPRGT